MQLTVVDLKARIARLERLERGFAREVALQRGAEDQLLFRGAEAVPQGHPGRPGRRRGGAGGAGPAW